MKRFIIVGLGNFGSSVAEALFAMGHEVIAIDSNERSVDAISRKVTRAVVGDGRSLETLERIGVKGSDAGVISTGDDVTASILATLALQDLAVGAVYVKVISLDHSRVLEKMGVTETIFPERESALRLGTRIVSPTLLNYVKLGAGFSVQEMSVPDSWLGKTLRQLELPRTHRVSVIALHDVLRDEMIAVPNPDAPLKYSDALLIAGRDADLEFAAKVK